MNEDERKRRLEVLNAEWIELRRRERKYQRLLEVVQKERAKVEKEIKNL